MCLFISGIVGVWYLFKKVSLAHCASATTACINQLHRPVLCKCELFWCFVAWQHWIANNLFGLAFALNGVELLHLNNVSTGCILLGGLFVYDIFWVSYSNCFGFVCLSFWETQGNLVTFDIYRANNDKWDVSLEWLVLLRVMWEENSCCQALLRIICNKQ